MKLSPTLLSSLLAVALSLFASAPALRAAAADAPAKKARAGQRLEKAVEARDKALVEQLGLTTEQQAKLAAIRKTGAEQIKAATGDRAKLREIAQAQRAEVRALLTPEQQAKFDAMPVQGGAGKGKGKKATP